MIDPNGEWESGKSVLAAWHEGMMNLIWTNKFIWPVDGILTGTTTPGQSGTGSNGNEDVLYIPASSRTGVYLLDGLLSYPIHTFKWHILLHRDSRLILQSQLTKSFCAFNKECTMLPVTSYYVLLYVYINVRVKYKIKKKDWLVGWLVGFTVYQPFWGHLKPN